MQCQQCGSDHVQLASVIVARETQTITGGGYVAGGGYVRTHGTSESQRAGFLTADEPRKSGLACSSLILVTLILPIVGMMLSCSGIACVTYAADTCTTIDFLGIPWTAWLSTSVLVSIAIIVIAVIVRVLRKNAYKRAYQSWLPRFYRRFYCHNCGTIIQN